MNIKTAHEKMAYDIGFDIGHSTDDVQAKLLNGLFKPFVHFNSDTQMCYITEHLDSNTKEMLIKLAEYCKED